MNYSGYSIRQFLLSKSSSVKSYRFNTRFSSRIRSHGTVSIVSFEKMVIIKKLKESIAITLKIMHPPVRRGL